MNARKILKELGFKITKIDYVGPAFSMRQYPDFTETFIKREITDTISHKLMQKIFQDVIKKHKHPKYTDWMTYSAEIIILTPAELSKLVALVKKRTIYFET